MSTMPGEQVDHVFAGRWPETIHFLESCMLDRPVMVTPGARGTVMQTYLAADLSRTRERSSCRFRTRPFRRSPK